MRAAMVVADILEQDALGLALAVVASMSFHRGFLGTSGKRAGARIVADVASRFVRDLARHRDASLQGQLEKRQNSFEGVAGAQRAKRRLELRVRLEPTVLRDAGRRSRRLRRKLHRLQRAVIAGVDPAGDSSPSRGAEKVVAGVGDAARRCGCCEHGRTHAPASTALV